MAHDFYLIPSRSRHLPLLESIESLPGNGGHILAMEAFDPAVRSFEELHDIACALDKSRDPYSRLASADMFRELGTYAYGSTALQLEIAAQERYMNLYESYSVGGEPQNRVAIRAHRELAYAHIYGWHAVNGFDYLPPEDISRETHDKLIVVGRTATGGLFHNSSNEQRRTFSGELGEISILLLLQRAALQIGPRSYWPYPALVTEDNIVGRSASDAVRSNWDVSVMTHTDEGQIPELTYALQVKTRRHAADHRDEYGEGIKVVYLQDVVNEFKAKKEPLAGVVSRLFLHQEEGQRYAGEVLDKAVDTLLDKIDE